MSDPTPEDWDRAFAITGGPEFRERDGRTIAAEIAQALADERERVHAEWCTAMGLDVGTITPEQAHTYLCDLEQAQQFGADWQLRWEPVVDAALDAAKRTPRRGTAFLDAWGNLQRAVRNAEAKT